MFSVVVALTLIWTVNGQPTPCCMESKWTASMTDIKATIDGNNVTADIFVDFDDSAMAFQYYHFDSQTRVKFTRVVTAFSKSKRYTIETDGTCTSTEITDTMVAPCIPNDATYLGSSYVGPETGNMKYDAWKFPHDSITLTFVVTNPGCVLINEGVVGTVTPEHLQEKQESMDDALSVAEISSTSNSCARIYPFRKEKLSDTVCNPVGLVPLRKSLSGTVDTVFFFNGYRSGIADPSVFDVPVTC